MDSEQKREANRKLAADLIGKELKDLTAAERESIKARWLK